MLKKIKGTWHFSALVIRFFIRGLNTTFDITVVRKQLSAWDALLLGDMEVTIDSLTGMKLFISFRSRWKTNIRYGEADMV